MESYIFINTIQLGLNGTCFARNIDIEKWKALKRNEQLKYFNIVLWDTRYIRIILATPQIVWLNSSTQYDHLYYGPH